MSLEIIDTEDSKQVFENLMEKIKVARGILENAVTMQNLATVELSKAENRRIVEENRKAQRLVDEYDRLVQSENMLKNLTAVVDIEIAEKKEAIAKTDKAFTGSRESLRSTFADLIQDAVSRQEELNRDFDDLAGEYLRV